MVGMDNKVKYNVEKLFYDNYRVKDNGDEEGLKAYQFKDENGEYVYASNNPNLEGLNIYQNNFGRLEGGRQHDPIYNDPHAKYQIYTFGDSWTYGWDLEQEQTFSHLLGDENTAVYNHGAGGSGLDFSIKTLSETYMPESRRQILIITVPHYFRRLWFDDKGVIIPSWKVKEQYDINEYNQYFNFLYNYEIVNRFVGRDKIIWGTWDGDLPEDMFDVFFERVDYTNDGLHPGPKAHKQYAEKIKDVLQDRFK